MPLYLWRSVLSGELGALSTHGAFPVWGPQPGSAQLPPRCTGRAKDLRLFVTQCPGLLSQGMPLAFPSGDSHLLPVGSTCLHSLPGPLGGSHSPSPLPTWGLLAWCWDTPFTH